jgi:enoyl-[acyl-carrier-protein] reductase (NADH)
MIDLASLALLKGKKALVTGIANDQSIAWGCAKAFKAFGADLAITYRSEKTKRYVDPLASQLAASIYMPLDVQRQGEMEAVFDTIKKKWGKLDIVLHSIASTALRSSCARCARATGRRSPAHLQAWTRRRSTAVSSRTRRNSPSPSSGN